jgi:hypothetical protein
MSLRIDRAYIDTINRLYLYKSSNPLDPNPNYFILGLAKLFFMVYRENIGQLKHLPFL